MASEVVGDVNTVSLKIKWEINNFSSKGKNVGDYLESPEFLAANDSNNIRWCLQLYPKGVEETLKDYLSIYLYANPMMKAVANFKIFNNEGEVVENKTTERSFNYTTGYGYGQFIPRDMIMNPINGILNDDKITIFCEITDQKDDDLPRHNVIGKYKALLNDNKLSDVSLISSEGKAVKVHKCILANSSPVFSAMFDTEMKEKQENTVEIADIRYDVLLEMVRYIYTGNVNSIDTLVGELATAADKYALDELKEICEKTMTKNLSDDNVIGCLQLANKLRLYKLEEKAIKYIVEKGSDVTRKPEFELLPFGIVCKVCRSFRGEK